MKLLITSIFALWLLACATPNYQLHFDNEINYYGVLPNDTILDLGYNHHIFDPLLATKVDSLHFYFLESINDRKQVQHFLTSATIRNLEFGTRRYATASEVKIRGDSIIDLPAKSVNTIIFRNYLWFFHKPFVIKELKRILKDNGTLIIVQQNGKFNEKYFQKHGIPFPLEKDVIAYYEKLGFINTKSFRGLQSPFRKRFSEFQLHFKMQEMDHLR
jgi:SAM-dependent methyltransferase